MQQFQRVYCVTVQIRISGNFNQLGPNLWISPDWEYRYASVNRYLKNQIWGMDQQTSTYLVWPPFASCSVTHLLSIELIRLVIVVCGMLSNSSSMAVWSCWILEGTGTHCRSRASQTCSMGNMSGEYGGHVRTGTFSASRNCVQILATWGCALSCGGWMAQRWASRISSQYLCALKLPLIKYSCVHCP